MKRKTVDYLLLLTVSVFFLNGCIQDDDEEPDGANIWSVVGKPSLI